MKARITHMKAPWPSGAKVGQLVEFNAGAIPAWALGKCVQVGDDAVADHTVEAPSASTAAVASNLESKLTREEREQIGNELRRIHDEAGQAARVLEAENAELREQLAAKDLLILELQTAPSGKAGSDIDEQAAAEKAQMEARAALEAEAKALGVEFSKNIGDKALAERIATKKGETK